MYVACRPNGRHEPHTHCVCPAWASDPYKGKEKNLRVKVPYRQVAEAIVAEPNRIAMTDRVVGSGMREGSREGLKVERRTLRETWNLFTMGDRFPMTNHSFRWGKCKV